MIWTSIPYSRSMAAHGRNGRSYISSWLKQEEYGVPMSLQRREAEEIEAALCAAEDAAAVSAPAARAEVA